MSPQTAVLHIDRLGKIGGQRQETIVRDVVHPLDDFRDRAACARHLAGLAEKRDRHLLLAARKTIHGGHVLRFHRKIGDPQAIVQERIGLHVEVKRHFILDGVANRHQTIRQPIAQPVAIEQRHHDVDIGLELDQPLARIGHRRLGEFPRIPRRNAPRRFGPAPRSKAHSSSWNKDGSDS